jgi:translation elongation factor EF-Tu-like GTPase
MKLTESELKQIIEEEIEKAIEEVDFKGNVGNVVKHRAKRANYEEKHSRLFALTQKAIDAGEPEKAKQYLAQAKELTQAFEENPF